MYAHSNAGVEPADSLVLEPLPNGEYAWLRPELDAAIADAADVDQVLTRRLGWPAPQPEPDDQRVALTDLGRRALAMERLFGQDWPNLAEASA